MRAVVIGGVAIADFKSNVADTVVGACLVGFGLSKIIFGQVMEKTQT